MMRRTFFFCLFILFNGITSFGQDLLISHGKKEKRFKAGFFVELFLPMEGTDPCSRCPHRIVLGRLIAFEDQKAPLELYRNVEIDYENGKHVKSIQTDYSDRAVARPVIHVSASEILSIQRKGNRKIREMTVPQTIGVILAGVGFGHLISAPFVKENSGELALVGGAEILLGGIISSSFDQKRLITHERCPGIVDKAVKIWQIA